MSSQEHFSTGKAESPPIAFSLRPATSNLKIKVCVVHGMLCQLDRRGGPTSGRGCRPAYHSSLSLTVDGDQEYGRTRISLKGQLGYRTSPALVHNVHPSLIPGHLLLTGAQRALSFQIGNPACAKKDRTRRGFCRRRPTARSSSWCNSSRSRHTKFRISTSFRRCQPPSSQGFRSGAYPG